MRNIAELIDWLAKKYPYLLEYEPGAHQLEPGQRATMQADMFTQNCVILLGRLALDWMHAAYAVGLRFQNEESLVKYVNKQNGKDGNPERWKCKKSDWNKWLDSRLKPEYRDRKDANSSR